MRIKTLYATKNGAYTYKTLMPGGKPIGLLWHSTGADNPWVMRYAGDSSTQDTIIGANQNNNGFQQTTNESGKNKAGEPIACSNAVMGLGTDGLMLTVKTLPDDYCPWCSGGGNLADAKKNGFSGNNANFLSFYQVEVCEDKTCTGIVYGRKNPYNPQKYADLCYNEMVAFSVDFFKRFFGGNPNSVTAKTLTSHTEGCAMGIASNHADPWHWLGKYGYSGDTLRSAVKNALSATPQPPQPTPGNAVYRVQVGAYKQKVNANEMLTKLKSKGFDALIVQSGELFKLQAGAYKEKANADTMGHLQKPIYPKPTIR